MKYISVVKLALILAVISIPLMAVDCCMRVRRDAGFNVVVVFNDTVNSGIFPTDSVRFLVLNAPNPAGDSSVNGAYYKRFYLNRLDSVSRAEIVYQGYHDTLVVNYKNNGYLFNRCVNEYQPQIQLTRVVFSGHRLEPRDGKWHVLDKQYYPQGSGFFDEQIQLKLIP